MRSLPYEIFMVLISLLSIVNLALLILGVITGFGAGAPTRSS
jgi:hypothetical protein